MPPHPRDGKTLLGHLGGPHTHLHNHIRCCRCTVFDRWFELRSAVFGCQTVVCMSSSACRVTMGQWGQCHHIPGMAGHCLVTLGGGAHTHCIRPLVRIAQRRSGVVRWRVRYPQQLGPQWGIALPNCTAKATHLRMPGHCLVTLGGGPHTHLKDHIRRCQHRVCDGSNCGMGAVRWCGLGVDTIFSI